MQEIRRSFLVSVVSIPVSVVSIPDSVFQFPSFTETFLGQLLYIFMIYHL